MRVIFKILMVACCFLGCTNHYTPLPRGDFRIELPKKEYQLLDSIFPYSFSYPAYSKVVADADAPNEPYWVNIVFPRFNSTIHVSYKAIANNIDEVMEDSRKLAYKHAIKADAIGERFFQDDERRVYGILYEIKGNAASPLQFAVTDSSRHFLRGALYFNSIPNKDSLAPVIDYIKEDMMQLMESVRWK